MCRASRQQPSTTCLRPAATSKSQFYQHFDDKSELVYDVITMRADEILSWQRLRLEKVDSFRGLYQWRDAMVQRCALRRGLWGCELGSLAAELSDTDDKARASLSEHFTEWQGLLGAALDRMREGGALIPDVDVKALATGLLAAVEGGYLLSQTGRDPRLMQSALNMAIGSCGVLRDRRHSSAVTAAAIWTDRPVRRLVVLARDGRRRRRCLDRGREQVAASGVDRLLRRRHGRS